jgi:SUMO ligase MMS21 Smc5/6 complex component
VDEKEEVKEEVPFACHICRKEFSHPVITKCGHFFCEKCAIERYNNGDKTCSICKEKLNGVFKNAKSILEKKKKKLVVEEQFKDFKGYDVKVKDKSYNDWNFVSMINVEDKDDLELIKSFQRED